MVTAGDVALVEFPFSRRETPSFKRRPVLVLNAFGSPPDQVVWVVMITSNARRVNRPGPGDIPIGDWASIPLAAPSIIRSRRVWTAEQRDVVKVVGHDPPLNCSRKSETRSVNPSVCSRTSHPPATLHAVAADPTTALPLIHSPAAICSHRPEFHMTLGVHFATEGQPMLDTDTTNKTRRYKLDEMEADHVTAWSRGGQSDLDNCQMLCVTHNRAKGNR